jgi:hypothetical protein
LATVSTAQVTVVPDRDGFPSASSDGRQHEGCNFSGVGQLTVGSWPQELTPEPEGLPAEQKTNERQLRTMKKVIKKVITATVATALLSAVLTLQRRMP